jgi:hypothetical protein
MSVSKTCLSGRAKFENWVSLDRPFTSTRLWPGLDASRPSSQLPFNLQVGCRRMRRGSIRGG